MGARAVDRRICYLCGSPIAADPADPDDALSRDHVPPRQFYSKEIRSTADLNLWVVPAHKRCNNGYREDEEYFYHASYVPVQNANRTMGQVFHRDFLRRAKKPQTPAMARSLLNEFCAVTDGGIHLPPGIVKL